MSLPRATAVEHLERVVETVAADDVPVPVTAVWTYGDVALGLDPVDRLDVYVAKDVLLGADDADAAERFATEYGVEGVGRTVRADWAAAHPEHLRANQSGHVAPERCLAAQLLPNDAPAHLEVCNTGFERNVTQRLEGALATETYERALDPRGVCLFAEGRRSETAFERLREGSFAFPTLPEAFEMLGADADAAERAAEGVRSFRECGGESSVRGDVV